MEKIIFSAIIVTLTLSAKQLTQGAHTEDKGAHTDKDRHVVSGSVNELQYSKYLKEVLELLTTDESLKDVVDVEHLSSSVVLGRHFNSTDDKVRSKLDELKRRELRRIRQLSEELKRRGQPENVIRNSIKSVSKHLDLKSLAKFGVEDLRKLILQANAEIAIIDSSRHQRFKEYEMHKTLEFEELLRRLNSTEQMAIQQKKNEMLIAHKRKQPSHMPTSKAHLLKVWEERDQMNKDNFNIKTFFHLHDLDGNGFLDEDEIKILLENEVVDYYDTSALDYDPKEREEDLERMREYSFNTIDLDRDHLINLEEFIANTKRTGFDDHVFWENLKRVPIFTEHEYAIYSADNRAEVNKLIDEGKITLPPSGVVDHSPTAEKSKE